jgi:hypothetical protein
MADGSFQMADFRWRIEAFVVISSFWEKSNSLNNVMKFFPKDRNDKN